MYVMTYIFIKCCNYMKRADNFGRELTQAGIIQAGIFTGGRTLGVISHPGKPRPVKRLPGSRLIRLLGFTKYVWQFLKHSSLSTRVYNFTHFVVFLLFRFAFVEFGSPDECLFTIRENNFMKINGRRLTLDVMSSGGAASAATGQWCG